MKIEAAESELLALKAISESLREGDEGKVEAETKTVSKEVELRSLVSKRDSYALVIKDMKVPEVRQLWTDVMTGNFEY
jgi:hypothetical protein